MVAGEAFRTEGFRGVGATRLRGCELQGKGFGVNTSRHSWLPALNLKAKQSLTTVKSLAWGSPKTRTSRVPTGTLGVCGACQG